MRSDVLWGICRRSHILCNDVRARMHVQRFRLVPDAIRCVYQPLLGPNR